MRTSIKNASWTFSEIVNILGNFTLIEKEKVGNILQHAVTQEKVRMYYVNYKKSLREYKKGKLVFSERIEELLKQFGFYRFRIA